MILKHVKCLFLYAIFLFYHSFSMQILVTLEKASAFHLKP